MRGLARFLGLLGLLGSILLGSTDAVAQSQFPRTDEPPPEVAAAGHDCCIIPLRRERLDEWLNPEPRSFWGLGDSEMKRYAPYCHIARECNSLRHLERTLDELLRSNSASA